MNTPPLRVGLFGIGLDTYWPQFAGLKERLEGYVARVAEKMERPGVEVVNLGLVDNPDRAQAAGRALRQADVDLIFLHVTTYALSSTVLPVVRRARVPVIVLNLAPAPAIDYAAFNALGDRTRMTGDWLASRCGWSPFEGDTVTGRPIGTIIRGHRVMWAGQLANAAIGEPVRFIDTVGAGA